MSRYLSPLGSNLSRFLGNAMRLRESLNLRRGYSRLFHVTEKLGATGEFPLFVYRQVQ